MGVGFVELPFDLADEPLLAASYEAWIQWRDGKVAPHWSDINLVDLPTKIIPMAIVVDVLDDGGFQYRFWGSGLVDLYGADVTGLVMDKARGGKLTEITEAQMGRVIDTIKPALFRVAVEKPSGVRLHKTNLRLPIIDGASKVNKILTVSTVEHVAAPEHENLKDVFDLAIIPRLKYD